MRGFTLIELLAVIVIIAIILLIATPLITNLIDNAKRGAFESSAKLIVGAAEIDFFSSGNVVKTFSIVDAEFVGNSFDFSGKLPDNGQISVREDGKISVAFQEGKFCAKKDFDDEIVITNYVEGECSLTASGPSFIKLLVDELNSTITSKAQLEATDMAQLLTIINSAISPEPEFTITASGVDSITVDSSNLEYNVMTDYDPYRLNLLPNINTNKAFEIELQKDGSTWTVRTLAEYNAFAAELPTHKIRDDNSSSVYASWDSNVEVEASNPFCNFYVLIPFNEVTNKFETYLNLMCPN